MGDMFYIAYDRNTDEWVVKQGEAVYRAPFVDIDVRTHTMRYPEAVSPKPRALVCGHGKVTQRACDGFIYITSR